jgi:hypothetical protein
VLRCGRALPQRKCTTVPASKHTANVVLCCILQPSVAGELSSSARLQNAAVSEQHSSKSVPAYLLLAAPLRSFRWGGDRFSLQTKKLAKSSLSFFCLHEKKTWLLKPVLRKGWGSGLRPALQVAATLWTPPVSLPQPRVGGTHHGCGRSAQTLASWRERLRCKVPWGTCT